MNAQTVPRTVDKAGDDRVIMSSFEVTSTQDKGYTSSNAATGFKTNEVLLKIPQAVTLVTRDLIDDIGYTESSDVLQFAGVSNFYRGESFAMRGTRIGFTLIDDMPDAVPYADNINIDSYTVLRGPASTLYLNASLGGTVLSNTKKPLSTPQYIFSARANEDGLIRGEFDLTGPMGQLGSAKFAYRLVGASQGGDTYFKNQIDERFVIHPSVQMSWNNTVIRFAYDHQKLEHIPNANNLITPAGKLYTGAGRNEAYFVSGASETHERNGARLTVLQKLADGWDLKLTGSNFSYERLGSNVFPSGGVNWVNQTMTYTARLNDRGDDFRGGLIDVNGKYRLLKLPMQTALGGAYNEEGGHSAIRATSTFGSRTVPISNPRLDLITAPGRGAYPLAANPGNRSVTYRANGYIQQTVELLPNRLTAIAGGTYSKIKINSVNNIATNPPAVVTQGDENLHRYGLVLNLTKDLVLYGMESTTFSPQNNRDINFNVLPSQIGTGRELGVKTAFLDGRISSTISVFKLELSNQAFFAGVRPEGTNFFQPIGSTTQRGFDGDLAITPIPGLQFVGSFFDGTVKDQAGARTPNSYERSLSFFGRYEFLQGRAKGLSIGGGIARISGRSVSTANYTIATVPKPALFILDPGNLVNVFVNYRFNPHWSARAGVDNVLDEAYPLGAQAAFFVDPSPPRTFTLAVTARF